MDRLILFLFIFCHSVFATYHDGSQTTKYKVPIWTWILIAFLTFMVIILIWIILQLLERNTLLAHEAQIAAEGQIEGEVNIDEDTGFRTDASPRQLRRLVKRLRSELEKERRNRKKLNRELESYRVLADEKGLNVPSADSRFPQITSSNINIASYENNGVDGIPKDDEFNEDLKGWKRDPQDSEPPGHMELASIRNIKNGAYRGVIADYSSQTEVGGLDTTAQNEVGGQQLVSMRTDSFDEPISEV